MKRVAWIIDNAEEILAGSCLVATVVLLFVQVVLRYFFGRSLAWTEEMSRYTFLFMVYIGASLAAKHDAHIRVTAQLNLFPAFMRKYVLLFSDLLWLGFNAIVIWEGFNLFQSMGQYRLVSASTGWDVRYAFLIIPLSFIAQSIRIIQVQRKRLRGAWQGSYGVEENL